MSKTAFPLLVTESKTTRILLGVLKLFRRRLLNRLVLEGAGNAFAMIHRSSFDQTGMPSEATLAVAVTPATVHGFRRLSFFSNCFVPAFGISTPLKRGWILDRRQFSREMIYLTFPLVRYHRAP